MIFITFVSCIDVFDSKVLYSYLWVQMERQMSMGSNMMGMQGPAHSSSCSSPHVPSMHSEAKLVSQSAHTHQHTHTHAYFPACLACMIWFCVHFLSSVIVTELVTCIRYTTQACVSLKNFFLSVAHKHMHAAAHTHRHTLMSFSLLLQSMLACPMYILMSRIHLCLGCLLALVWHGGDLIQNKAASQSSWRHREREKEEEKETDWWRNPEGGSSSFL